MRFQDNDPASIPDTSGLGSYLRILGLFAHKHVNPAAQTSGRSGTSHRLLRYAAEKAAKTLQLLGIAYGSPTARWKNNTARTARFNGVRNLQLYQSELYEP